MGYNVVILVGGDSTGTRFRPLSIQSPKLLFPIAGKPLIEHIIDGLISQVANSIDNIYLLGFYKDPSKFEKFVDDLNLKFKGLNNITIKYLSEINSKGTGGGLYYFKESFFHDKGVIFIHGDIVCDYPFKDLVAFHEQCMANVTMLGINPSLIFNYCKQYLSIQNGDSSGSFVGDNNIINKFGTIFVGKNNFNIEHYVEKPSNDFTIKFNNSVFDVLINGGIYLLDNKMFNVLQDHKCSYENDKKLDEISLELDIFKKLPDSNLKFNVFKYNKFWYNLKTPLSALLANNFFLNKLNQNDQRLNLGPNVSIGKNVKIGHGVRIKNSIIGNNVIIGDNSLIMNSIIDNNVKIGKWCRIEGSINYDTIKKDIIHTNGDGNIRLINNIVVLCENTSVLQDKIVFNSIVLPHKELKDDTKYEIVM